MLGRVAAVSPAAAHATASTPNGTVTMAHLPPTLPPANTNLVNMSSSHSTGTALVPGGASLATVGTNTAGTGGLPQSVSPPAPTVGITPTLPGDSATQPLVAQIASAGMHIATGTLSAMSPIAAASPGPTPPPRGIPVPVLTPSPALTLSSTTPFNAESALSSSAPGYVGRSGSWSPSCSSGGTTTATQLNQRRQKRLVRNRESARLSRRRRKHYLEVLEERVTVLSDEMDRGRMDHVAAAVRTVRSMRDEKLGNLGRDLGLKFEQFTISGPSAVAPMPSGALDVPTLEHNARMLDTALSRTSDEMRVAAAFRNEQLKSLSFSPPKKFLLWLTLQNDAFFRGGRAPSERLSAARIGERMLHSGTERATPSTGMWPLLCNEVGLSYDQEERVRNFQRQILSESRTWLHRHTVSASGHVLQATNSAILAINDAVQRRERELLNILTLEQRVKFQAWASIRSKRIVESARTLAASSLPKPNGHNTDTEGLNIPKTSKEMHDAANLYIAHYRLQRICETFPPSTTSIPSTSLKKLARRPSFESLASSSASLLKMDGDCGLVKSLTRDRSHSCSSSGSLKRSASEVSICGPGEDGMDAKPCSSSSPLVTPEAAQAAATHIVTAALGVVKDIIPPPPHIKFNPPSPNLLAVNFHPQSQHQHQPKPQPQPQVKPQYQPQYVPTPQAPILQTVYPPEVIHSSSYHPAPTPLPAPLSITVPQTLSTAMHPEINLLQMPVQSSTFMTSAPTDAVGRHSDAIPSVMNAVPEEGCLKTGTEDFLFDLTEEDWAIGEGFDMEIS